MTSHVLLIHRPRFVLSKPCNSGTRATCAALILLDVCAGREIAKFMAAVQAAVYGAHEPVLTPEIWGSVLQRKLHEHQERRAFRCADDSTWHLFAC